MKKIVCLLIAVILLMSGCASNKYQLIKEDEHYYIHYDGSIPQTSHMEVEYVIPFNTMKEMKDAIINVDFTEEQLKEIAKRQARRDGKIYFLNIDELYEPVYPSDLNLTVECGGNYYNWRLTNNTDSVSFGMCPTSEENFSKLKDSEEYLRSFENKEVLSTTNTADRNATVVQYIDVYGNTVNKSYYIIETDEKTLIVQELVTVRQINESFFPYTVYIYGEQNGEYFYAVSYELNERPSVEWLSQFGIREYVETSAS